MANSDLGKIAFNVFATNTPICSPNFKNSPFCFDQNQADKVAALYDRYTIANQAKDCLPIGGNYNLYECRGNTYALSRKSSTNPFVKITKYKGDKPVDNIACQSFFINGKSAFDCKGVKTNGANETETYKLSWKDQDCKERINKLPWEQCQAPSLYKTFLSDDATPSIPAAPPTIVTASVPPDLTTTSTPLAPAPSDATTTSTHSGAAQAPVPPVAPTAKAPDMSAAGGPPPVTSPTGGSTPPSGPSVPPGSVPFFTMPDFVNPTYVKVGAATVGTVYFATKAYKEMLKIREGRKPEDADCIRDAQKLAASKGSKWKALGYASAAAGSAVYGVYTLRA